MRAGDLRHYAAFQDVAEVEDGMGGITETWSTSFSAYIAIWPFSVNESAENMRISADVTHKIRMRYRTGVTPIMRIVWNSRTFEIKAIISRGKHTMDLVCLELDVT